MKKLIGYAIGMNFLLSLLTVSSVFANMQVTAGANQTGKNFIATAVSCATWSDVIQKYQDYVNCQAP